MNFEDNRLADIYATLLSSAILIASLHHLDAVQGCPISAMHCFKYIYTSTFPNPIGRKRKLAVDFE